jgi:hypothetical protein
MADWNDAVMKLAEVAPRLAFKEELVNALRAHAKLPSPPVILLAQLEVIVSVAKQNIRVAQLHGYAGLEMHAKAVEIAVRNVVSALKNIGVSAEKNQQANAI